MVWVGFTRPSMKPIWMPSASDIGIPRWKASPSTTEATPRSRAASSMRLRVPSWSSGPHRPQLETRAAISVKDAGDRGGHGHGHAPVVADRAATVFAPDVPIERWHNGAGRAPGGRPGDSAAILEGLETDAHDRRRHGSDARPTAGRRGPSRRVPARSIRCTARSPPVAHPAVVVAVAAGTPAGVRVGAGRTTGHRRGRRPPPPHDLGSVEALYAAGPVGPDQRRAGRPVVGRPARARAGGGPRPGRRRPGVGGPPGRRRAPSPTRRCAGCGAAPSPATLCVLAANSGDSGNGYWPGDGSDGMEGDYMASAGHRQNMLNAGYDTVGVGVTLQRRPGVHRRAVRLRLRRPRVGRRAARPPRTPCEGDPVPAGPAVAGAPDRRARSTARARPSAPNGAVTATGGQYPYPYPVPPVPGEP